MVEQVRKRNLVGNALLMVFFYFINFQCEMANSCRCDKIQQSWWPGVFSVVGGRPAFYGAGVTSDDGMIAFIENFFSKNAITIIITILEKLISIQSY